MKPFEVWKRFHEYLRNFSFEERFHLKASVYIEMYREMPLAGSYALLLQLDIRYKWGRSGMGVSRIRMIENRICTINMVDFYVLFYSILHTYTFVRSFVQTYLICTFNLFAW